MPDVRAGGFPRAFYNRVEFFSQRSIRYDRVTESEVPPLLSRGSEAFYHPFSGELGPVFRVHLDQLRTLRDEASAIISRPDTLLVRIRREQEELR